MSDKQDIIQRFSTRAQAERYEARFQRGRRRRTHLRESRLVVNVLRALGDINVLIDVGCGPGRFVPAFRGAAKKIFEVDYSPHMLAISRENNPLAAIEGGYAQADARFMPFATGCADVVFCHRLLNHFRDDLERIRIMHELSRVANRYVILSCLTPPAVVRSLRRLVHRLRAQPIDDVVGIDQLSKDAKEAGLRLERMVPIQAIFVTGQFLILTKNG